MTRLVFSGLELLLISFSCWKWRDAPASSPDAQEITSQDSEFFQKAPVTSEYASRRNLQIISRLVCAEEIVDDEV
jgi:hypothetical protein